MGKRSSQLSWVPKIYRCKGQFILSVKANKFECENIASDHLLVRQICRSLSNFNFREISPQIFYDLKCAFAHSMNQPLGIVKSPTYLQANEEWEEGCTHCQCASGQATCMPVACSVPVCPKVSGARNNSFKSFLSKVKNKSNLQPLGCFSMISGSGSAFLVSWSRIRTSIYVQWPQLRY